MRVAGGVDLRAENLESYRSCPPKSLTGADSPKRVPMRSPRTGFCGGVRGSPRLYAGLYARQIDFMRCLGIAKRVLDGWIAISDYTRTMLFMPNLFPGFVLPKRRLHGHWLIFSLQGEDHG